MIENLIKHGMRISNMDECLEALSTINYYRLSTYWFHFKIELGGGDYRFIDGLDFQTVLAHHEFDRKLRNLVLQGTEIIEIALRQSLSSYLALSHGAFGHQDSSIFEDPANWKQSIQKMLNDYHKSREEFAKHFQVKYSEHLLPPVWVSMELASFGTLSHFYANIKSAEGRGIISKKFDLDEVVLTSFLRHLTIVRNICAHHARLWNRRFPIKMKLPNNVPTEVRALLNREASAMGRIYNSIVVMDYVLKVVRPDFELLHRFEELLNNFPQIDPAALGHKRKFLAE